MTEKHTLADFAIGKSVQRHKMCSGTYHVVEHGAQCERVESGERLRRVLIRCDACGHETGFWVDEGHKSDLSWKRLLERATSIAKRDE